MNKEIKHYKVKQLPSRPLADSVYWVKASPSSEVSGYITDLQGVPYPLKDISGSGGIQTITNTDGNISIVGSNNIVINISPALLSVINSALQTETDPIFQASEASLFVAGDKANLDNQSGINTGDETTLSIQTKRPLKTINGESLEGSGNIIVGSSVTNTSELINDGSDGTSTYVETDELGAVATSNDYNDLDNLPTIPNVPNFADQTEVNAGTVNNKTIAPDTLAGWWTYVKGLAQTFAQKITFSSGALFSPQASPTYEVGRVYFDEVNDCISFMDSISGTSVQVGYEVLMRARNNTGATIPNGSVVYISGAIGQNSTVALAQANTLPTSEIIGIATHDISNNTVGKICVFGLVNDLNTSSFTDGQMLYLSATVAGGLTSTIPVSPNFVVALGVVEHAHPTQGKILVRPQRALANNNSLGTAQNVPPTQNAVKTALDSKLDKVTTTGVERAYIINTDGSQGTKATSDFKDVLEFANLSSFPATGESGKIYVALDTNFTYRWSGSAYIQIGGGESNDLYKHWFSITAGQSTVPSLITLNTNSPTEVGTQSVLAMSGTSRLDSFKFRNYLTATTSGANGGIKESLTSNGSFRNGVDAYFIFGNNNENSNFVTSVGFYGLLTAIPNLNISDFTTSFCGVGNDSGDANLSFFSKRNSSASTVKVSLGSDFPAHTLTDCYILRIEMPQTEIEADFFIKMTITNLLTGVSATHTFNNTQSPEIATNLCYCVNINNRNTGLGANIKFSKLHVTRKTF